MWVSGIGPACSVTIVNVGLTIRSGGIPNAFPIPLQKRVFPAPRSPVSATTSPGRSASPSARAIARVSAGEFDMNRRCTFSHIRICPPCSRARARVPLRCVRDLRPLTAIPLLAGDTLPLHPPTDQECPPLGSIRCPTLQFVPVGYPFSVLYGALRGTPRCALRMSSFFRRGFAERLVERPPDCASHGGS